MSYLALPLSFIDSPISKAEFISKLKRQIVKILIHKLFIMQVIASRVIESHASTCRNSLVRLSALLIVSNLQIVVPIVIISIAIAIVVMTIIIATIPHRLLSLVLLIGAVISLLQLLHRHAGFFLHLVLLHLLITQRTLITRSTTTTTSSATHLYQFIKLIFVKDYLQGRSSRFLTYLPD
jgi:hypothetical protein